MSNLLNYQAQTPAAKSLEQLITSIDSAKHQWDTYGAALSLSFKQAYGIHEKTLKEVEQRFKTESSDIMYFLLAAFAVGAAGGIVGVLVTPIINKAGQYVSNRLIANTNRKLETMRNTFKVPNATPEARNKALDAVEKAQRVSDVTRAGGKVIGGATLEGAKEVGVKSAERADIEKMLKPPPLTTEPGDVFKPPSTDPHQFDLLKRIEIGICASLLKENIKYVQIFIDRGQWSSAKATEFLEYYREENDFLSQQPNADQIAAAAGTEAQKMAELAMWIAWANARDQEYWKIRLKGVEYLDSGVDYNDFRELKKYDPVLDRLYHLGYGAKASKAYTVRKDWAHMAGGYQGKVLSIPHLKQLGRTIPKKFFGKVDDVVRNGRLTMKDIEQIAKDPLKLQ